MNNYLTFLAFNIHFLLLLPCVLTFRHCLSEHPAEAPLLEKSAGFVHF